MSKIAKIENLEAERLFKISLSDLNKHTNWIIKEPRICLLWPFFAKLINDPFYIVVNRNPEHIAYSLKKRNNFSIDFGILLWQEYMKSAICALKDNNFILIDYDKLVENPALECEKIYKKLLFFKIKHLRQLSENEIYNIVQIRLRRSHRNTEFDTKLSDIQLALLESLRSEETLKDFNRNLKENNINIHSNLLKYYESDENKKYYVINKPKISSKQVKVDVNIVTYNDADYLQNVLEDISGQSYNNLKINIFDDCSTDHSIEIIKNFAKNEPRCEWTTNSTNLGLVRNFNKALTAGNSDLILFKSGNDRINSNCIEKLVEMHRSNPELGLAYAKAQPIFKNKNSAQLFPDKQYFKTDCKDIIESAVTVMQNYTSASPLWGLYKRKYIELCKQYPHVQGGDHIMTCELSLYSSIDYIDELLIQRDIHMRTPQQNSLLHSEDMARGMNPSNIFFDQSFRVSYALLIYEHIDMIFKSRIDEKTKTQLASIARKVLIQRFNDVMIEQLESFIYDIRVFLQHSYTLNISYQRFIVSIVSILNKCLVVLEKNKDILSLKSFILNKFKI